MTYLIKVYKKTNIVKKEIETYDLTYVCDLPYRFSEKPTNICNQLNDMFENSFEHIIDVA